MALSNLRIYNFTLAERIEFGGIMPDSISDSAGASFDPLDIDGRSSPLYSFKNTEGRTLSFNITVYEDEIVSKSGSYTQPDLIVNKPEIFSIVNFVRRVKALVYPQYSNNCIIPPKCYVRIGNDIKLIGFCDSVGVDWKLPIRDGRYVCVDLTFSFKEVLQNSPSASDIRNNTMVYSNTSLWDNL